MNQAMQKRNGNGNGNGNETVRYRDPLTSFAREFFGFDPFSDHRGGRNASAFTPSFEVLERDDSYLLRADLPGVKEEDLDVSLHKNVLTISGMRQSEERKEGETYYLYERSYGNFTRSFSLPEAADGERIEANLKDGVLNVSIGKKAESKPKKISLKK